MDNENILKKISDLELEFLKVSRELEQFYIKARVSKIPEKETFLRDMEYQDAVEDYQKIKANIEYSFSNSLELLYEIAESFETKEPDPEEEEDLGFDQFHINNEPKPLTDFEPEKLSAGAEEDSPEKLAQGLFDDEDETDSKPEPPPKLSKKIPSVAKKQVLSRKEVSFINKAEKAIEAILAKKREAKPEE